MPEPDQPRAGRRRGQLGGQRPDKAIVLHPGPMVRGMEISAAVADSDRSVIVEQVANGVSVRMAVLYLLLSGSESAIGSEEGHSQHQNTEPKGAVA
nr:hypothetical protein [Catenulispora pinisilvae]